MQNSHFIIYVIVPVYNSINYIEKCIDSLINQTIKNIEIILIDDGSDDGSESICDKYANKYKNVYVIHQNNLGLSAARNKGLEYISKHNVYDETYVGFVDSDDWIDLQMYEVLYSNIKKYDADIGDVDSVITNNREEKIKNSKHSIQILEGNEILKDYIISNKVSCCRKLYKYECVKDIKFAVGKIHEDILANYLFLHNARRIVKDSYIMYYYYLNPKSITGDKFKIRDLDLLNGCKKLCEYSLYNEEILNVAKIKYYYSHFSILSRYIKYNADEDFINAKKVALEMKKQLAMNIKDILTSYLPIKKKILVLLCLIFPIDLLKGMYNLFKR